jgi:hypothetical protein
MFHGTPFCVMAKRLLRVRLDALERRIFQGVDLDAVSRGWTVGRPRPFTRTYRDARFDYRRPTCGTSSGKGRAS